MAPTVLAVAVLYLVIGVLANALTLSGREVDVRREPVRLLVEAGEGLLGFARLVMRLDQFGPLLND